MPTRRKTGVFSVFPVDTRCSFDMRFNLLLYAMPEIFSAYKLEFSLLAKVAC